MPCGEGVQIAAGADSAGAARPRHSGIASVPTSCVVAALQGGSAGPIICGHRRCPGDARTRPGPSRDVFLSICQDMSETTTPEPGEGTRNRLQWKQLFHAFRLSLSVPQILIAAAGVLALAGGHWVFSQLPFAPENAAAQPVPWSRIVVFERGDRLAATAERAVAASGRLLLLPFSSVYSPAAQLLRPDNDWPTAAFAWTKLLYALVVWAIVAGAVTRIAAVQFAAEQSVGLRGALRFSLRQFLANLASPLLPVAGLLMLWMLGLVGGWIGAIPSAGPLIVGALWFLALLLAIVMAVIVIGIAGSWPLMYATISTEDSDAFDGFSRSFSYVFSRPRQWCGLTVVSFLYGTIATLLGVGVAYLVVYLAGWSVASGMGAGEVAALTSDSPFMLPPVFSREAPPEASLLGPSLARFWLNAFAVLVCGFAVSLFWSLATVMYFVLRQYDDATPLSDVYLPDEAEEDELLPLVGVAASEQPPIERPIEEKKDGATPDKPDDPATAEE